MILVHNGAILLTPRSSSSEKLLWHLLPWRGRGFEGVGEKIDLLVAKILTFLTPSPPRPWRGRGFEGVGEKIDLTVCNQQLLGILPYGVGRRVVGGLTR